MAPNTPLVGFHSIGRDCATFRVCLVGVVVKQETLSPVVKKLKLCGAPSLFQRSRRVASKTWTGTRLASWTAGRTRALLKDDPCLWPRGLLYRPRLWPYTDDPHEVP